MLRLLLARLTILALLFALPAAAATYAELLASADALVAEQSWEQAKLRYTEALATAPDAAARARCELLIEDAAWRSEASTPLRWRDGDRWQQRHLAAYDRLEEPYRDPTSPRPRDDFWVDLLTRRIVFERFVNLTDEIARDFSAVADHLGSQPPSPAAARRFVDFLQRLLDASAERARPLASFEQFPRLRASLTDAARIASTPDDHAWSLWQLARLTDTPAHLAAADDPAALARELAARWSAALNASANTRWAPQIRAEEFLWRVHSRYSPDLAANTPADIPALLAELKSVRATLTHESTPDLFQNLDALERELTEPRLDLAIDQLIAPAAPVRFSYGSSGLSRLVVALDRTTPGGWFALGDTRFNPSRPDPRAHRPDDRTSVREWTLSLPDPARLAWSAAIVDAATNLPPGLYALTITGEKSDGSPPVVAQRKFAVSSLRGLGLFSSNTNCRLFIYHADGHPAASLAAELFASTRKSVRPFSATTDDLGSLSLPPLDENEREVIALVGGEPVCFANTAMWHGPGRRLFLDVYTDRPLFRPGETAHWKLIARERHGGRFTIPQNLHDLKFQIKLRDQLLVAPTALTLSATGSATGEIQLPAEALAGEVSLQLVRGDAARQPIEQSVSLFQVDRFVVPAATSTVAFTGDARSFRPGRTLTARVSTHYFSGGPVVGAPAQFVFHATNPFHPDADGRFAKWSESLRREPRSATTDTEGAAEATLTLPDFFPDGVALAVAATVTPDGTPALNADASVTISTAGLTLDPLGWTSPRLAAPSENVSFSAIVRDGRGSPVALDLRAQLLELRWTEVWLDAQGQPIPPDELAAALAKNGPHRLPRDGAKLVHAGYTESTVAETDAHTGTDGRLAATFALPRAGLFHLRVRTSSGDEIAVASPPDYSRRQLFNASRYDRNTDPTADSRRDRLSIVAVDNRADALALNPETAALVTPAELAPGQPARVLAIVPAGITQAWLSLAGENSLAAEPVAVRGRIALHTFAAPPSALGRMTANLLYRSPPGIPDRNASATIPVSRAENTLHVAITPAAPFARPGQSAALILAATDSAGRPAASAELAVRAADDAVTSLLSSDDSDPTPNFLRLSDQISTREIWSTDEIYDLRAPLDPRSGAIRNPAAIVDEDGEVITLSPFAVEARGMSYGYAASNTLAGARVRTELKDSASAISVVTSQFPEQPITLRRHFASTAFWSPSVITDSRGEARITFTYPDNLTRWSLGAYALGADGNTFGAATAFTETSLPFQARLQLPRFLIAGDTAEPSATLVNRTDADLRATATLELSGPIAATKNNPLTNADLLVPKQAESHAAWPIHATAPGTAELKLTARAGAESDAMSLPLPILEDGLQQHTAAFARLAPAAAHTDFTLELPATLDPLRTSVSVQLSPNYALTLLDALPYLIDYPYGCVEQTMSRFLPAVVVRKTLTDLDLDADAVEHRILAHEPAADKTRREHIAGFVHLDDVVAQSLARLEEAQTYQGFGWWPGAQSPDLWMTAYVSWGLSLATDAGVEIPDELGESTTRALANLVQQNDSPDDRLAFAWAALARTQHAALLRNDLPSHFTKIFSAREKLSASGRACLALAAKKFGTSEQLATLLRNLDNGVERASAAGLGDTAHWGTTHGYWRAMDGAVESTALTLLALLEFDPANKLIEPAANWLALNRRSSHWSSTRDTAFAILALDSYLKAHGQLDATGEIELLANNQPVQRMAFSRATLLTNPSSIEIPATALRARANTFTLRRLSGANPVLATAFSSSWARGDDVKPLSHLVEVARRFERQKSEPTLVGTLRLTSTPLEVTGAAGAGEEVTARVTLTASNDCEYVMISVPKPAGCEPLNPLSGWDARLVRLDRSAAAEPGDNGQALYREEHDDRSVFFLDHLEAGRWELRFRLRAVTPGDFRALPVVAEAMYAPEIAANSDARRLRIDRAR